MIQISFSSNFKKAFKKKVKKNPLLEETFFQKLKLFSVNPFHPSLKTHKLTEELEHLYSFSTGYDIRVVFSFVNKSEVILENIGTHDEVY